MDPDEDVSLPAMSFLISRFDGLFCCTIIVLVFLLGGYCMLLYHFFVTNILSTAGRDPLQELFKKYFSVEVLMVVARRNIKSIGIGIRETSG